MSRTVEIFYIGAMFYIHFKRDAVLIHTAQRTRILPGEFIDWLVAEKLP